MNILNKILCFIDIHDWEIIGDPFDAIDDITLEGEKPSGKYYISCEHKCSRCGKEEYIGMGYNL